MKQYILILCACLASSFHHMCKAPAAEHVVIDHPVDTGASEGFDSAGHDTGSASGSSSSGITEAQKAAASGTEIKVIPPASGSSTGPTRIITAPKDSSGMPKSTGTGFSAGSALDSGVSLSPAHLADAGTSGAPASGSASAPKTGSEGSGATGSGFSGSGSAPSNTSNANNANLPAMNKADVITLLSTQLASTEGCKALTATQKATLAAAKSWDDFQRIFKDMMVKTYPDKKDLSSNILSSAESTAQQTSTFKTITNNVDLFFSTLFSKPDTFVNLNSDPNKPLLSKRDITTKINDLMNTTQFKSLDTNAAKFKYLYDELLKVIQTNPEAGSTIMQSLPTLQEPVSAADTATIDDATAFAQEISTPTPSSIDQKAKLQKALKKINVELTDPITGESYIKTLDSLSPDQQAAYLESVSAAVQKVLDFSADQQNATLANAPLRIINSFASSITGKRVRLTYKQVILIAQIGFALYILIEALIQNSNVDTALGKAFSDIGKAFGSGH